LPNHDRRWRLLEKHEVKMAGNEKRERKRQGFHFNECN
jgi:hypothetical protein